MNFWKDLETKPLDPDDFKKVLERVRNQPEQMPTYIVCREDWQKINALSKQENISHFSAYLKLLSARKIRPGFAG